MLFRLLILCSLSFTLACDTQENIKEVDAPSSIYLDVVNRVLRANKWPTICKDSVFTDPSMAYHFFVHGERAEHLYNVDTIGRFIIERSGFGYKFMTTDFYPGIDAWIVTDTNSGKQGQFLNLFYKQKRNYNLYASHLDIAYKNLDSLVIPYYQNEIRNLMHDLSIRDIESLRTVLGHVLGYRIKYKHEIQIESFLHKMKVYNEIFDPNLDTLQLLKCEKALKGSYNNCPLYFELCDLYETPSRALFQVFFSEVGDSLDIDFDIVLLECELPELTSTYRPISENYNRDTSQIIATRKKYRKPELR